MITAEHIENLVNDALNKEDLFLVEVSVESNRKIKVVLDSDKTVSIADCISVNRVIEQNLDRDEEDFSLEVTSAGWGQPLKLLRQYNKYIGKELEITIVNGTMLSGELKKVNSEFVELLEERKKSTKLKDSLGDSLLHRLPIDNIKQARAIVTI